MSGRGLTKEEHLERALWYKMLDVLNNLEQSEEDVMKAVFLLKFYT